MQQLGPARRGTCSCSCPARTAAPAACARRARHRPARAAHAGVDRRPARAGPRGHVRVRRAATRSARRTTTSGFQYERVAGEDAKFAADWGLKLQLTDLRSVISRARAGRAPGVPGRAFGRRLDRRRVRGLGLRRPPRLPRPRRARADRRRAAGQLRVGRPGAGEAGAGRHPHRQGVPRPARHGPSRDQRHLRPGGRALGLQAARRAVGAPGVPAAAGLPQAAGSGHERGAVRIRVRREHLAGLARPDPHPRGTARRQRRPARLARTASSRRSSATRAPMPRTIRTRPSGTTRAACCSTSTPPARCARRRPRSTSGCGCGTETRSTGRSMRSARPDARARGARREAAREALEDPRSSRIVDDRGTSHLDPLSAAPAGTTS